MKELNNYRVLLKKMLKLLHEKVFHSSQKKFQVSLAKFKLILINFQVFFFKFLIQILLKNYIKSIHNYKKNLIY